MVSIHSWTPPVRTAGYFRASRTSTTVKESLHLPLPQILQLKLPHYRVENIPHNVLISIIQFYVEKFHPEFFWLIVINNFWREFYVEKFRPQILFNFDLFVNKNFERECKYPS